MAVGSSPHSSGVVLADGLPDDLDELRVRQLQPVGLLPKNLSRLARHAGLVQHPVYGVCADGMRLHLDVQTAKITVLVEHIAQGRDVPDDLPGGVQGDPELGLQQARPRKVGLCFAPKTFPHQPYFKGVFVGGDLFCLPLHLLRHLPSFEGVSHRRVTVPVLPARHGGQLLRPLEPLGHLLVRGQGNPSPRAAFGKLRFDKVIQSDGESARPAHQPPTPAGQLSLDHGKRQPDQPRPHEPCAGR